MRYRTSLTREFVLSVNSWLFPLNSSVADVFSYVSLGSELKFRKTGTCSETYGARAGYRSSGYSALEAEQPKHAMTDACKWVAMEAAVLVLAFVTVCGKDRANPKQGLCQSALLPVFFTVFGNHVRVTDMLITVRSVMNSSQFYKDDSKSVCTRELLLEQIYKFGF